MSERLDHESREGKAQTTKCCLSRSLARFAIQTLLLVLLAVTVSACVEEPGPGSPPIPPAGSGAAAAPRAPARISIDNGPGGPGATPTPYFGNYWGKATLDGANVPVGAVVEALNPRGDLVGRFVVNTAGFYGYVRVYGEDPTATPPIPGMKAGEVVIFKINGKSAATNPSPFLWQNSLDPVEIDLTALSNAAAPPAAAPTKAAP